MFSKVYNNNVVFRYGHGWIVMFLKVYMMNMVTSRLHMALVHMVYNVETTDKGKRGSKREVSTTID